MSERARPKAKAKAAAPAEQEAVAPAHPPMPEPTALEHMMARRGASLHCASCRMATMMAMEQDAGLLTLECPQCGLIVLYRLATLGV